MLVRHELSLVQPAPGRPPDGGLATQTRAESEQETPMGQASQRLPAGPHALELVPAWHWPKSSQQPLGQVLALHWPHTPFTHAEPIGQTWQAWPPTPHAMSSVPLRH
jgi:hypothetical protein